MLCKNGHEQNLQNIILTHNGKYMRCKLCIAQVKYNKLKLAGQPTKLKVTEDRFWQKILKKDSGCWEWQATLNNMGYGMFTESYGKFILAHRYSYKLHKGEIGVGLEIDHLCFNPKCCNPDHLEAVTPSVNVQRSYGRRKQINLKEN
jgi:hypothetical protein